MRNRKLIVIFSILLSVTILVLMSSILFSVESVVANCLNSVAFKDGREELNQDVINNVPLIGENIFLIDDEKIINHVDNNVPTIKALSVQRIFPNKVRVHYVKMFSYFHAKIGDTHYEFLCDGKVVNASTTQPSTDRINIIADFKPSYNIGEYILSNQLIEITSAFERIENLQYQNSAVFFEVIDFKKEAGVVFIKIRNSNTAFKIHLSGEFVYKLQLAYSFLFSNEYNAETHTLINVVNDRAFASSDQRYVP